jgi:hypothetical protein
VELVGMRLGNIVAKDRFLVRSGRLTWEIDLYKGSLAGLVTEMAPDLRLHIFIDFGQLCSSKPTTHVHGNRTAVFMISTTCFQAGPHTCKAN